MNRMMLNCLAVAVFALGGVVVAWMGSAFMITNTLALLVIVAIALCYVTGIVELIRFNRDTTHLNGALKIVAESQHNLDAWLDRLPRNLRNPIRLRILGEQGVLPTLVLAPHLTGLLVMLGLLGTFVGMVITLQGAVSTLEGTSDLDAIRSGLTAPIQGLGLAFGTSVAGVSASAALGFVATLYRRERQTAIRALDASAAAAFRSHSPLGYREQVLTTLQEQTRAMPELVARLTEQSSGLENFFERIDRRLTSGQEAFHQQMLAIHRELAASVGQSLQQSLADSGRLAGDSIRPVVAEAMKAITIAASDTQRVVQVSTREQLQTVTQQLGQTTAELRTHWLGGLSQLIEGFERLHGDAAKAASREQALIEQQQGAVTRINDLINTLDERSEAQRGQLSEQAKMFGVAAADLSARLDRHGSEQTERMLDTQEQLNERLAGHYQELSGRVAEDFRSTADAHSRQILEQITPLLHEAMDALVREAAAIQAALTDSATQHSEALSASAHNVASALDERWTVALTVQRDTQAAFLQETGNAITALHERFESSAGQLLDTLSSVRESTVDSVERETVLRREQQSLAGQLAVVAEAVQAGAASQHKALERFVANAEEMFAASGARADQQISVGTDRLTEVSDEFAVSVTELASLGDALLQLATGFDAANERLKSAAEQLESAVLTSASRSDEQMGYYVAQAREVIDYSVQAQQALIEQMRQLSRPA